MKGGFRFGIVVSRFNVEVTEALLSSCVKRLARAGVPRAHIVVVRVPGGYEIPWAVNRLAATKRFDAVIALGCVLRGQTPQNDHISRSVFQRLHDISISSGVPCILGIITPNNWKQAVARTQGKMDRGLEAAEAALEMAGLRRELDRRYGKA
ncbi:MAG: 6,7-dimethyl-8-ribityllumazine synthase [Elusimicrobia bacterium]|nr:6,7-dimethyl-8-ribityllumazine synthase [Elusimicrobiota bacterium]